MKSRAAWTAFRAVGSHDVGGFAAILLWSTSFALARSLAERVGAVTAATSTSLVAGALCLPTLFQAIARGVPRHWSPRYIVGCGSLFVAYEVLILLAIGFAEDRQQLLEVGFINYLWPTATLILSVPLLGKRATLLFLPSAACALAGVWVILSDGADPSSTSFARHVHSAPVPYLFALAAALAWALYSTLTRRWAGSNTRGAVGIFLPATGLALLGLRLSWHESSAWSPPALAELVVLGTVTASAYALWDHAIRKGNVVLLAASSNLTPLLSAAASSLYLGVRAGRQFWVGGALVVIGSLISWRAMSALDGRDGPSPASAQ